MKLFLSLSFALLTTLSTPVFSHSDDEPVTNGESMPEYADAEYQKALSVCLKHGAAAAKGAVARFHDAPLIFKYVSSDKMNKDMPNDGIYGFDILLGSDRMEERRKFEESASFGWKEAGKWIKVGKQEQPEFIFSMIFFDHCKKLNNIQPNQ